MNNKFDYFMERTEKDLDEIKGKLDQLWNFRLLILGASAAISAGFSIVLSLLMMKLNG